MKNKWRIMLSVVAAVFLLSLLAIPVAADTTTATRAIGDTTLEGGQSTTVTVTITTDEFCVILTDVVPAGWVVSDAEASGANVSMYSEATGEFLWLDTGEDPLGTVTATYTLTVPVGTAANTYDIDGTVMDVDWNSVAIVGGESSITVGAPPVGTTATRDIADQTLLDGESTTVTVTIITTDEFCVILTEDVPAGWVVSDAEASGADVSEYSEATGEFLWLDTGEDPLGTVTATYTLTVPVGTAANTYDIDGTVMDVDLNSVAIVGGESAITVGVPPTEVPTFADWLYDTFIA